MDNQNYTDYLSDSEKETLKNANKLSNKLQEETIKNNNIFSLANIKNLFQAQKPWYRRHRKDFHFH